MWVMKWQHLMRNSIPRGLSSFSSRMYGHTQAVCMELHKIDVQSCSQEMHLPQDCITPLCFTVEPHMSASVMTRSRAQVPVFASDADFCDRATL